MKKLQRKLRLRVETLHHFEAAQVAGATIGGPCSGVFTGPGLNTFSPGQLTYACTSDQAIMN